jgi:hypothetical protein
MALILFIGVALGYGAAWFLMETRLDHLRHVCAADKKELTEEIKRLRAQVAKFIGT